MKICSVCNKNLAVIYTTKIVDGESKTLALCIDCAKDAGIPVLDQIMQQSGITQDEIENLNEQMDNMLKDMNFDELTDSNFFSQLLNPIKKDDDDENEEIEIDEEDFKKSLNDKSEKKSKSKNKKTKNLDTYGVNLTALAAEGKIDEVIGRSEEIQRAIQILNRRSKNNPVLIGEPGVGKTAIAEGLALRIAKGDVPEKLRSIKVYLLDLTAVVAGTQFRGQFEGRMKAIIDEVKEANREIVVVIDEIHNIMGAGEVQGGAMNAANILKPALARGEIQLIGTTTLDEYRKHIEKDAALERRFQPVYVEEPTVLETIEIIKGIKRYYEEHHRVIIEDDVIKEAVLLSERYIRDRFLPDKAIDVIDEAASKVNLNATEITDLIVINDKLDNINSLMEIARDKQDYENLANYKMDELKLKESKEALESKVNNIKLKIEDVASVVEQWTKIPVQRITEDEAQRLLALEDRIKENVIGQKKAIESLSKAIRRNRSGFKKKKKPSSFIFVGPTGVGKTQLVKTLAKELFNSEDALIRIDMSEYMEKHTVSKLIGAPPGYVGYDEGGQLTEKVRRKPYSVILLDEIEKAHQDVFNMLLQILEDGRLTDSQGKTVSFENTIIVMTSNAGTNFKGSSIGFAQNDQIRLEESVNEALKEHFKPEFLNRIDDIIVFNSLTKDELKDIINIMLKEVFEEAIDKNITIEVTDSLKDYLLEVGYDSKYGARPLRRAIQKNIEDKVCEEYLKGNIKENSKVVIDYVDNKVTIK
ncbi:MAG: ATP-dependent Clp protease ATP-binding subunit [Clostridium sp.]|uniref:ATP-dependent Clp protease ATP-binding subunit n=1 Tax=Clostridium sp. TaxID=1506 RepID=UPI002FC6D57A